MAESESITDGEVATDKVELGVHTPVLTDAHLRAQSARLGVCQRPLAGSCPGQGDIGLQSARAWLNGALTWPASLGRPFGQSKPLSA